MSRAWLQGHMRLTVGAYWRPATFPSVCTHVPVAQRKQGTFSCCVVFAFPIEYLNPRARRLVWPLYWLAQGTMFWALFVVGHDCGHQSFSSNQFLNNLVGNITHSSILVPYHGWRISHRKHHTNHGHVENDESWHPLTEKQYEDAVRNVRSIFFPPSSVCDRHADSACALSCHCCGHSMAGCAPLV